MIYMSDKRGRAWGDGMVGSFSALHRAQTSAMDEARRILAATAPAPVELHRHVRCGHDVYPYETDAQVALAAALGAAVADGGLLDRLAGGAR